MANRTGMEVLIATLENLYLDYLAFRHIAKAAEPQKWAAHLNDYRRANSIRFGRQFDEIADVLRTSMPACPPEFDAAAQRLADLLAEGMVS